MSQIGIENIILLIYFETEEEKYAPTINITWLCYLAMLLLLGLIGEEKIKRGCDVFHESNQHKKTRGHNEASKDVIYKQLKGLCG